MRNTQSNHVRLLIVFLTVFIDLVGFGIVLPLLPLYTKNFGDKDGWITGGIVAVYSLMQFLFAPAWGRWSDRIGRRPLMLFGTFGAAIAYAIFALGANTTGMMALAIIFGSRAIAGFCGANLTVAQAYIADITPPEKRSKSMALIGVAFGLGFIFGPVIGGWSLSGFHFKLLHLHFTGFGLSGPGWVASALCLLNFVGAWFMLPESLKPTSEHAPRRPRVAQWFHTLGHPQIGLLIGVFFLSTFAFTCFEVTLGLLVSKNFHLDFTEEQGANTIANLFAYCGIVGVFVQGGLVGRLVKTMGEARLIALSLVLVAISLGPMAFIHSWGLLLLVLAVLSLGTGLTRAPVFGLISILAPPNEQGATLGVAQSVGSLARITGPIFAAAMFYQHPSWPYVTAGAMSLVTAGLVMAWIVPACANVHPKGEQTPVVEA